MLIPIEYHDMNRIKKLNTLNNINTFWDDVRKFTRYITSDHSIERWQVLAGNRYKELEEGKSKDDKNIYK